MPVMFAFILLLSVFGAQHAKEQDNLCPMIRDILCINETLSSIVEAAKKIAHITKDIETNIFENEYNEEALLNHIDHIMTDHRSNVPKSVYHYEFKNIRNNINHSGLIDLIGEENDAFSYLYNSIEKLLKIENPHGKAIGKSFEQISTILRRDVLCNYRNILRVYSRTWSSIDQIKSVHISITHKRNAPSFLYNSYSIVLTRLLREWVKNVNDLTVNIGSKMLS